MDQWVLKQYAMTMYAGEIKSLLVHVSKFISSISTNKVSRRAFTCWHSQTRVNVDFHKLPLLRSCPHLGENTGASSLDASERT